MGRTILRATSAALVAALILPLLFVVAEAVALGEGIAVDDFRFAYALGVPLALAVSLLVAWPAERLMPGHWAAAPRYLVLLAVCFIAPVAAIWPAAGEFPWKGGLAGMATSALWAVAFHASGTPRFRPFSIRSKPRG